MSIIDIRNIYKIYNPGRNEVRALDGVNLKIEEGEFVAIVGPSGSGKSTLMNILGCLDTPSKGSYYLGQDDVSTLNDNRLSVIRNRHIGFIFQGFNLINSMDALQNVSLPLVYRGFPTEQRKEMAKEALVKVGLWNRMHHLPSELSGGQQQRVSIARAIASSPQIILADEPTGNLDSVSGREVMDILYNLHREGRTIILITHDESAAASIDRQIKIQDGKIIRDCMNF